MNSRPDGGIRTLSLALVMALISLFLLGGATAAFDHDRPEGSEGKFDHSAFDALLAKYVDEQGLVAYRTWKEKDVPALKAYLRSISKTDPKSLGSQEEKIAFWVNTYNALTLRGILEFYPLDSIKDKVSFLPFGYNIWKDYKIEIAGKERSLDDIEHKILRKKGEPRIHFVLVCASIGCPRLALEAYRGDDLDKQLDEQTRRFLNDPEKTRLDRKNKTVHLSKIFSWFEEDFGGSDEAVLQFVANFRPEEERDLLLKGSPSIDYLDYDWSLNVQKE